MEPLTNDNQTESYYNTTRGKVYCLWFFYMQLEGARKPSNVSSILKQWLKGKNNLQLHIIKKSSPKIRYKLKD